MGTCEKCGAQIADNYKKCYTCFKNEKKGKTAEEKEGGGIDLQKTIELPLWVIIGIFIAGVTIGAYIW